MNKIRIYTENQDEARILNAMLQTTKNPFARNTFKNLKSEGALYSIAETRKKANMSPDQFDKTVIRMANKNIIALHKTDIPERQLSEKEKDGMLRDHGNYYIGMALVI